jgi:hypothetical protein
MKKSPSNLINGTRARYVPDSDTLEISIRIPMSEFSASTPEESMYVMGFAALALEGMKGTAVTLARKNYMYGNSSIAMTGEYGIAVRSFDKVARLLNIYRNNVDASQTDESLADTWKDLQGYGFIGHASSRNYWDTITKNASDLGSKIMDAADKAKYPATVADLDIHIGNPGEVEDTVDTGEPTVVSKKVPVRN